MTRLARITPENMTTEQMRVYQDIEARGGRLGGPYLAYIRIPRFMRLNQEMGDYLRRNSLTPRLRSLVVLRTVRHWGAKYAWAVNARSALEEGLDQSIIDAIDEGRTPENLDLKESAALQVTRELLETRTLSDGTYRQAVELFGEDSLVDVVVTVGFHSMVSMTLNAFDIDPPGL